jgi:CBS domain-containing protein
MRSSETGLQDHHSLAQNSPREQMRTVVMVLVQHILDAARRRLVVLSQEASASDAAGILTNPTTPLVVVCDSVGIALGVISRTDIIKAIAARIDVFNTSAGALMTQSIFSCHIDQTLQRVWEIMNARSLKSAPILDAHGRPQGVVHARDLVHALLDEITAEEELLRDYVLGIGYQ